MTPFILVSFRFLLHEISVIGYCHIYCFACFLLFVFNHYIWHIYCKFSSCVYFLIPQHCRIFLFTHWFGCVCVCVFVCVCVCVCVCTICLSFHCQGLCMLSIASVKMEHPEVRWPIVFSCCPHNWHLPYISSFKILFLK